MKYSFDGVCLEEASAQKTSGDNIQKIKFA